jgi:hypothetical protein
MAVSDWSGASLPWVEELGALKERIGALFGRAEPRRQVGLLLEGLIGALSARMAGNWRNTPATRRRGGCRRFSAGRYGIKRRPGTSAGIL